MRLIDADELREQLVWCKEQAGRYNDYWDDVIERLDSLPTVDAVHVVRCKDCKNWIPGVITEKDEFIPPKCGKG